MRPLHAQITVISITMNEELISDPGMDRIDYAIVQVWEKSPAGSEFFKDHSCLFPTAPNVTME
jgi:hypothetical protein